MNSKSLKIVEIIWEQCVWNATRPIPSVHKHLGYVTYESPSHIHIAPEITYSSENRLLRVGHEQKIQKQSVPIPTIFPLEKTPEKTNITEIDYEDPFHWEGIHSANETKNLKPSTFRLLGFLAQEDERYFWMAPATFEYQDGLLDYETPHLVPKPPVLKQTFFKRMHACPHTPL